MAIIEKPVLPIELASEPPAVESPVKGEASPEESPNATKDASPKEPKTKKVPAQRKRSSPTHPPYFEMIKDAIVTLKDRTGSSQYAITKFIEDKQKALPSNFRKVLLVQLKKLVANDKLVKVKSSFKLPSNRPTKPDSVVPVKKKSVSVRKPKTKASAAAKEPKAAAVSKPKLKAKTAVLKTKALAVKAKPVAKSKSAAKPKVKAAPKRKEPEKSKAEKKPVAKVAKTAMRSTPRKASAVVVSKKKVPVKKTPAKSVKPKSIKSPAKKKAVTKRGKK